MSQSFAEERAEAGQKNVQKEYRLRFTGTGGEYFKIWIVNIAFTILTLGIYGAWAKVRREQYLMGHTYLGDTSFDYTADAWSIFKGRILVFLSIVAYTVLYEVSPILGVGLTALLFVITPWFINQSLKFKSRYITYRNIPFGFDGTVGGILSNFIISKSFGYLTGGLLLPWAKFKEKQYLVNNVRYGTTKFLFKGKLGHFYVAYFLAGLFIVPLAIALGFIFYVSITAFEVSDPNMKKAMPIVMFALFVLMVYAITPFIIRVLLVEASWNGAEVGKFKINFTASAFRYFWIVVSNLFLRIVSLGLATPYCVVRVRNYMTSHFSVSGSESVDSFVSNRTAELNSLGEQASELYDLDIDIGI